VAAREPADETPGRWVDARDLRVGDLLLRRTGELARIQGIGVRDARMVVYNLRVAELHNYAVGEGQILAHNPTDCNGQQKFGFRDEAPTTRPTLPAFRPGGKTSGVLRTPTGDIPLQSGWQGPASSIPRGTSGFDIVTRTHVEGHAAAVMRQQGLTEATVYMNNPEICPSCSRLLPRMLPPRARLNVVLPDGTVVPFTGVVP